MKMQEKIIGLTMFDFMKGLGILAVLVRHSIYGLEISTDSLFWKDLYSVVIPAFFMTSGYWLKKRSFQEGLAISLKQLLKPYLIVIVCIDGVGLFHRLLQHNLEEWLSLFLRQSILVISGEYSRIGFMWFVFALMVGWILFYGLIQIRNEKWQIGVSVLLCFFGTQLLPHQLPFQLAQGMIAQFFLYIGYLMKRKKFLEKKLSVLIVIILTVIWLGGGYFSYQRYLCDLSMYQFGNGMPAVICSLCGSVLVLKAGIWINAIDNPLIEKIGQLGRYTMWILCIHSFEATVFPWSWLSYFISENTVAGCLAKLLLRCLFIFCICILLKRIGEKKHVGKNY